MQQEAYRFLAAGQFPHRDRTSIFGTGETAILPGFGSQAVSFRERCAEHHFGISAVEPKVVDGKFQSETRRSVAIIKQNGIEPGDIVRRQVEFDGGFAEFDLGILRIIVRMFSRDERNVEPGFRKFGIPETHSAGHIHVDPTGIPRHVISGVVDRDLVVIPDVDNISRRNDSRPERQGQVVSDRNIVRIQIGQIVLLVDTRILPRENCKNSNSAGSS